MVQSESYMHIEGQALVLENRHSDHSSRQDFSAQCTCTNRTLRLTTRLTTIFKKLHQFEPFAVNSRFITILIRSSVWQTRPKHDSGLFVPRRDREAFARK